MICHRIEGKKREGKPSLTTGRTVTGAGIAALTRQHRQNLMFKGPPKRDPQKRNFPYCGGRGPKFFGSEILLDLIEIRAWFGGATDGLLLPGASGPRNSAGGSVTLPGGSVTPFGVPQLCRGRCKCDNNKPPVAPPNLAIISIKSGPIFHRKLSRWEGAQYGKLRFWWSQE